jgi:hypothetical protein
MRATPMLGLDRQLAREHRILAKQRPDRTIGKLVEKVGESGLGRVAGESALEPGDIDFECESAAEKRQQVGTEVSSEQREHGRRRERQIVAIAGQPLDPVLQPQHRSLHNGRDGRQQPVIVR